MVNRCFDVMLRHCAKVAVVSQVMTLVCAAAHAQPSRGRLALAAVGPDDVWRLLAEVSGDYLPWVVVIFLALFIVLAIGFLLTLLAALRAHRRIAAAETFLSTAFRLEGLRLEGVADQFRELDRRTADLMREFQELQRAKIQPRAGSPSFVSILTQLHGQAATEIDKLKDNAPFKQIDGVLQIQTALAQFESHCAQLARETNLPRAMLTALESKDTWNAMLTIPNLLEAYFDEDALRPLLLRLRAIEYVLRAVFLNFDVDIVVYRPFLSTDAAPTRAKDAPRNLASLPGVRQRAAEGARAMPDRAAIVMDCFAPGWNSNKIGRRPPQFTIYEPNS